MKISKKAQKALDQVVARFRSGDLSPIVAIAKIRLPEDAPARKWTMSNRVLAYAQIDDVDCRGYRQWQQVGRQVQKGQSAAYIYAPRMVTEEDDDGDKRQKLIGWLTIPVFGASQTEGEPLPPYEPQEPPPLVDVARALNLRIKYEPELDRQILGWYAGDRINLSSQDAAVFFHELAHALHERIEGQLKGGQDARQETIAEFTACVLMELYDLGDRSGNSWRYIAHYNKDPLLAITQAVATVERILEEIEQLGAN